MRYRDIEMAIQQHILGMLWNKTRSLGLTKRQLAEKAGVHHISLSRLLSDKRGARKLAPKMTKKIMTALDYRPTQTEFVVSILSQLKATRTFRRFHDAQHGLAKVPYECTVKKYNVIIQIGNNNTTSFLIEIDTQSRSVHYSTNEHHPTIITRRTALKQFGIHGKESLFALIFKVAEILFIEMSRIRIERLEMNTNETALWEFLDDDPSIVYRKTYDIFFEHVGMKSRLADSIGD